MRPRNTGVTLVELLVVIAITVLMMAMINKLFLDTSRAVGQGVQLSDIIATGRAVSEQIQNDADAMYGPSSTLTSAGFMVVLNKNILAAPVATRDGETTRDTRADQVLWLRHNTNITPLTAGLTTSYGYVGSLTGARVWYGHVRKTLPTGLDSQDLANTTAGNLNRLANQWVLGRQALLFCSATSSPTWDNYVNQTSGTTNVYESPLFNTLTYTGTNALYMGLLDVVAVRLSSGANGIYEQNAAAVNWRLGNTAAGVPRIETAYESNALTYAFGVQRLRANPSPQGFDSWRLNQMHPILANNCSDFEVAFAADVADDAGIAGFPDGEPDVDGTGLLIWYDGYNCPAHSGSGYDPKVATAPALADHAFVWRHDDTGSSSKWPYMIRIRFRLHDKRGEFETTLPGAATERVQGKWFEQIIKVNRP